MDAPSCIVCPSSSTHRLECVTDRVYWRCRCCDATFLDARHQLTIEQEKAHYDLHQNTLGDIGYRTFLNRLAEPMMRHLTPGQEGLDFGCGPGPLLALIMTEAGYPCESWDPLYRPAAELLNRRYDFITCSEVIEHLFEPAVVFGQLIDRLNPSGWLGLMTQFQTDDERFAQWHYRRDPTHVVFYRASTLSWLAQQYGCSIYFPSPNVALLQTPEARPAFD
ncbi:MAG: class I SAM-dependent methyltransferase [Pseudomonadota bacterium]